MNRFKITLAIAGLCSLFTAPSAQAYSCDSCVVTAVTQASAAITASIKAVNATLIQQLQQLRNEQNSASTKVADAVGRSGDNVAQRNADTQKAEDQQEIRRATQMPIDPCAQVAQGAASPDYNRTNPGAAVMNPRGGGDPKAPTLSTGSASLDKAARIANFEAKAPSPEVQALLAQAGSCEAYAAGIRSAACAAAGTRASISSGLPDADVLSATLFSGAQGAGDVDKKISMTFNGKQIAAAAAYIRNLTNPVALRELAPAEAKTDAGKAYFALRDAYQARLDMAERPLKDWVSHRVPYDKTIAVLKAMREGDGAAAKYLVKELSQPEMRDWESKGVSLHQMMVFESQRRYQNPAWLKEISSQSDQMTLAREQLLVSAQIADLLTRQIMETQKQSMILGAIYQASLSKDFMPELVRQHQKAATSR